MTQSYGPAEKSGGAKKFGNFNRDVAPQHAPRGGASRSPASKGNDAPLAKQAEPEFVRDEAYEASPGIAQALAAVDAKAPVILLTGRAGTGKTRLVQYIKSRP